MSETRSYEEVYQELQEIKAQVAHTQIDHKETAMLIQESRDALKAAQQEIARLTQELDKVTQERDGLWMLAMQTGSEEE